VSGPSTPKHSADKRERKRAAGLVELRMYVPRAMAADLRAMIVEKLKNSCTLNEFLTHGA